MASLEGCPVDRLDQSVTMRLAGLAACPIRNPNDITQGSCLQIAYLHTQAVFGGCGAAAKQHSCPQIKKQTVHKQMCPQPAPRLQTMQIPSLSASSLLRNLTWATPSYVGPTDHVLRGTCEKGPVSGHEVSRAQGPPNPAKSQGPAMLIAANHISAKSATPSASRNLVNSLGLTVAPIWPELRSCLCHDHRLQPRNRNGHVFFDLETALATRYPWQRHGGPELILSQTSPVDLVREAENKQLFDAQEAPLDAVHEKSARRQRQRRLSKHATHPPPSPSDVLALGTSVG